MNNKVKTVLVIAILAVVAGGGFFGYNKYKTNKNEKAQTEAKENEQQEEKTYTKEELDEMDKNGQLKTVEATDTENTADGVVAFFYQKFMEQWDVPEDKVDEANKQLQEDIKNGIISEDCCDDKITATRVKSFGIKQVDVDQNDSSIYNIWYIGTYTEKDATTGETVTKDVPLHGENPYSLGRVKIKEDGSYQLLATCIIAKE